MEKSGWRWNLVEGTLDTSEVRGDWEASGGVWGLSGECLGVSAHKVCTALCPLAFFQTNVKKTRRFEGTNHQVFRMARNRWSHFSLFVAPQSRPSIKSTRTPTVEDCLRNICDDLSISGKCTWPPGPLGIDPFTLPGVFGPILFQLYT